MSSVDHLATPDPEAEAAEVTAVRPTQRFSAKKPRLTGPEYDCDDFFSSTPAMDIESSPAFHPGPDPDTVVSATSPSPPEHPPRSSATTAATLAPSDTNEGFTVVTNRRKKGKKPSIPSNASTTHQSHPTSASHHPRTYPQASHSSDTARAPPLTPSKLPAFLITPNDAFPTTYDIVTAIETEHPHLRFKLEATRNLNTIIIPLDEASLHALNDLNTVAGKPIEIKKIDPNLTTRKFVLQRYPLNFPLQPVLNHVQVEAAQRCEVRGEPTRQVLISLRGPIPPTLDLKSWGTFDLRPYTPEPLRCFNCQRFGHHQTRCTRPPTCAVCSSRHPTQQCLDKLKAKEPVTAKCPNCQGNHHAWNKVCPARKDLVQRGIDREHRWVQERLGTTLAPPGTFTWGQQNTQTTSNSHTLTSADFPPLPSDRQTPSETSRRRLNHPTNLIAPPARPALQTTVLPTMRDTNTQTEPEISTQTLPPAPTPPPGHMLLTKDDLRILGRQLAEAIALAIGLQIGKPIDPEPILLVTDKTVDKWLENPLPAVATSTDQQNTPSPAQTMEQPPTTTPTPDHTTPHGTLRTHKHKQPAPQPSTHQTPENPRSRSLSRHRTHIRTHATSMGTRKLPHSTNKAPPRQRSRSPLPTQADTG